jgi:hypothetical protein
MHKRCLDESVYILKRSIVYNFCQNSQGIGLEIFISRAHIFGQTLNHDEHIVLVYLHDLDEHID